MERTLPGSELAEFGAAGYPGSERGDRDWRSFAHSKFQKFDSFWDNWCKNGETRVRLVKGEENQLDGGVVDLKEVQVDGKFLLLMIRGEGSGEATLSEWNLCLPKYKEVKKEDKTYVKVVSAKTKITPGLIVFQVGNNLFSGDNVIGDDIIRVMNENWNVFLILTLKEIIRRLYRDHPVYKYMILILVSLITMKSLTVLLVLFVCCQSVKIPANFKKCNRKEPKWKECVFEAGIDGLSQMTKSFPELNIPNLNPLEVPEINIEGSGRVSVNQHFNNVKIFGITKVKADKFEFDFDKKTLVLEGTFPELRMPGNYKLDGTILLFPIKGEGTGQTTLINLYVKCVLGYEEVKKKGKTYMKFVKSEVKITPGKIHFNFNNLFNGDKTLGDNINQLLNDNWAVDMDKTSERFLL
ncbi:hypothetical protein GEV33_002023 [Tenebrio molitor]|uniref:Uncharacterized protein n=1 Tax=Tenebrio molitor TaxID=7067 RepID=A0A8J6HV73_TENMO|nr:hypothetical protein GEV33_002023 [Tenebrio molitor]